MDETNKGVGGEQQTPPVDIPATEPKNTQEPEKALSNDFPSEQGKQNQAFASMRKQIDDLKEELARYKTPEPQPSPEPESEDFDLVNMARGTVEREPQGYAPQPQYPPQYPPYQSQDFDTTDPATKRFLDEAQAARFQAEQARQDALRAQAQMEDFEAWTKYPQLNPKSSSRDKEFIGEVQKEFIAERLKALQAGKRPPRLVEAADRVQKKFEEITARERAKALAEAQKTMDLKQEASLESTGTSVTVTPQNSDMEHVENLRARIRRGDMDALVELNKLSEPYIQTIPDDAPY